MSNLQEFFAGYGVRSMDELIDAKGKMQADELYAEYLEEQKVIAY